MKIIVIDKCNVCPWYAVTMGGHRCRQPANENKIIDDSKDDGWAMKDCPIPDWCPLDDTSTALVDFQRYMSYYRKGERCTTERN